MPKFLNGHIVANMLYLEWITEVKNWGNMLSNVALVSHYQKILVRFKGTLKAFNDFKNKQKSIWSNVFWYLKVCIFCKCI